MTAQALALRSYASTASTIQNPSAVEYDVLAGITRRLARAIPDTAEGFRALASALHDNRRLWAVFAADVADERNELPKQLRADLFALAEFTKTHTSAVLARRAEVAPLIDINTAVMRGLQPKGI